MPRFLRDPRLYSLLCALAFLFLVFVVVGKLIKNRPLPQRKESVRVFRPRLDTLNVKKGSQSIKVQTYGTVEAMNSVTLVAPYAGKVEALSHLYPGKYLKAHEILFSLEKIKLKLSIDQQRTQIDELSLKEKQLEENQSLLSERVITTQRLLEIAQQGSQKQKEQLANERQLYRNIEELYTKEAVSNNELLNQESKFLAMEVSYLEAVTREANVYNNLLQLKSEVNNTLFSLRSIKNQKRLLELEIEELQADLDKSDISVDFPAQISEVFTEKEEEVSPGKQLATVRAVDSVEITVSIPDSYFKWLYAGPLLQEVAERKSSREMDIVLVNRGFRKHFSGGFIKSVGDSVNIPTRSLPVVIGRNNPRDTRGELIAKDELKPGMYCEVTILLHRLDDVFLIPREALQSENQLFYISPASDAEAYPTLGIIKDVTILHESAEGVVVELPKNYQQLQLVTSSLKRAWEGMEVEASSSSKDTDED